MFDDEIRGNKNSVLRTSGSVRHHFTVYEKGEATGLTAAKLFDAAARRIESLGPVFVRHTAMDTSDDSRWSEVSLTVYFDVDATAGTGVD